MMKQKQMFVLATAGFLLSSCLGPQTYFSTVFSTLKDLYYPVVDNNDRLVMNYAAEAAITVDGETSTYNAFFFNTGFKLTTVKPTTVNQVTTTETLTSIYDYADGGYFAKRVYGNNLQPEERVYRDFDQESFDVFKEGVRTADSLFTAELTSVLKNQATNLIIGGQPEAQDVKVYTLPIGNFVDLANFEDLVGFVPTSLGVVITFTTSTNQGRIALNATGNNQSYAAVVTLSQPNLIQANQHLLTSAQKLTYQGYVA
jgi:hypothetical protein